MVICGSSTGKVGATFVSQFHSVFTITHEVTRPFFAKDRVTDFRIFDSKTSLAIHKMEERFKHNVAVDFQEKIFVITPFSRADLPIFRTFALDSLLTLHASFSLAPR